MNTRKPEPLIAEPRRGRTCPVCGKQSYSLEGIHPQCAMQQADAPRQRLLAEEKRKARLAAEKAGDVAPRKRGRPAAKVAGPST
jgi:hypothetical protein